MRLVIIESPWRADTEVRAEQHRLYLQLCIRDSILRGESPYASHQMLTQALDDTDTGERDIGIRAGYAWWRAASTIAFYVDLGWSEGMLRAFKKAKGMNVKVEERKVQ